MAATVRTRSMVAAAKIAKLSTEKSRCSGLSLPWIFCLRGERGMGRSVPDIARDIGSLLGVGCAMAARCKFVWFYRRQVSPGPHHVAICDSSSQVQEGSLSHRMSADASQLSMVLLRPTHTLSIERD